MCGKIGNAVPCNSSNDNPRNSQENCGDLLILLFYDDFPIIANIYSLRGWLATEAAAIERVPVVVIGKMLSVGQALRVDACRDEWLTEPLVVSSETAGGT